MIYILKTSVLILLTTLVVACSINNLFTSSYTVTIDSITSKSLEKNPKLAASKQPIKYIIEPSKETDDDLRFNTNTKYLIWALSKQQYINVNNKDNADIVIQFDYKYEEVRPMENSLTPYSIELKAIYPSEKNNHENKILWQTSISLSNFYQLDTRKALQLMFSAAFPYIGTDTNGIKNISIKVTSPYLVEANNLPTK